MKLESPDWGYFAAAWSIVAVGLGFLLMSDQQIFGLLLTALGLLMVAYSLRPTIRSAPVVQRLHRWGERRRKVAEQEQLRRQVEPLLVHWNLFHSAAGATVARFYELRDADGQSSEDWHSFKDVVERALLLSQNLSAPDKDHAYALLRCFLDVEQDALERCSVAAADLNHWLLGRNTRFLALRQQAGLPAGRT